MGNIYIAFGWNPVYPEKKMSISSNQRLEECIRPEGTILSFSIQSTHCTERATISFTFVSIYCDSQGL